MAVRIASSMKQLNDNTDFPVAYGADLWLDKNKGEGTADYDNIQHLYNTGELGGGGSPIQVETLPTASVTEEGNIYQYVGESGTYQKGHFYECILAHNGTDSIYAWEDVDHLRFNHVVYHCTVPPVNEEYKPGDIIYYSGKTMGNFKNGYYYRAIPNATPQQHYGVTLWVTPSSGFQYLCYTPFELRIGFIVYPTGTGGESTPYQITDFDDEGITISPYGWSGTTKHFVGASYATTVEGWEELEGGGGTSIFYGTMDEWNALSADEKKQYEYMSDEQAGSEDNGEWKTAWTGSVSLPNTDGQENTIISGLSIANAKRIAIKLGSNQGNRIPDIAIVEHLIGVTNIGSASVCYLGDAEYYCCASFKVDFSNGTIRGNFISYKWAFTNTVVGVYWQ